MGRTQDPRQPGPLDRLNLVVDSPVIVTVDAQKQG
jgi:hypothetical protein